jgi:phospholipid/cholesterol/gamma-HCH transport system substrate-binding protein
MRRGQRARLTRFQAGLLALVVISTLTWAGLSRFNPFYDPFEIDAVVHTASNIAPRSPVRVAGIEVGKVTKVESLRNGTARVHMALEDRALPIHADAQLKIRPRIFLGGNFFVELHSGSPSARVLKEGATLPLTQTSSPVQLGDVLADVPADTRRDLRIVLSELQKALDDGGAEGLRQAIAYSEPAYRSVALAADAALGQEPRRDVQRFLRGTLRTSRALVSDEEALKGLVTNLNAVTGALAEQDVALAASVPALRDLLRDGQPALGALNDSLPSLRLLAREAIPGVRRSGPLLEAALPAVRQARKLVGPRELQGTAKELRKWTPSLVKLVRLSVPVLEQGRAASRCTERVLVPLIQTDFPDPDFPDATGTVLQKAQRSFVGLSGESRTVDANQSFFHSSAVPPPQMVRPAPPPDPTVPPRHRPDMPCENQKPPNLQAPAGLITPQSTGGGGVLPLARGSRAGTPAPVVARRRRAMRRAKRLFERWTVRLERKKARLLEQGAWK